MANGVTPELLAFILQLAQFLLIAFAILIGGAAVVYITMFWKGHLSASGIAGILRQTDVPKLATIIMIVLAASLLGLLRIIEGEAVIALLSGIAGFVLGHRGASKGSEAE
jgi:TRAP-type C4-dicarboxylate transport system permease small subunit